MDLKSTKAIVTGGASGMGREFTLSLARDGATVSFCDLDEAKIAEVVAEAADLPGKVYGFVADVSKEDQVVKLIADASAAMGGLNGGQHGKRGQDPIVNQWRRAYAVLRAHPADNKKPQRARTLVAPRPRQRCSKGARTTEDASRPSAARRSQITSASRAMLRTVGPVGTPRLL